MLCGTELKAILCLGCSVPSFGSAGVSGGCGCAARFGAQLYELVPLWLALLEIHDKRSYG